MLNDKMRAKYSDYLGKEEAKNYVLQTYCPIRQMA